MKKYQQYIDSDEWEFIPYNSHDVDDYNTNKNGLTPNSELEIKEFVSLPNGLSGEVNSGGTHEQVTDGNFGTPMLLPPKTKVFSEKLKITIDGKKKSYAKIAKKLSTEKDIEALNSPIMDKLSKQTAELNIKLKNKKLGSLFKMQQMNKLNGIHGKQVAKETKKDYEFKLGGMKKYDIGGEEDWKQSVFNTPYGRLTPTGVDLNSSPLLDWGQVRDIWQPYSEDKITSFPQLQELMYDYTLDKAEKGDKSALKQLGNMWKTYGITNKNEKSYQKYQDKINKGNLSLQDYKDLRGSFLDNLKGKRALLPMSDSAKSELSNIKDSDLIGDNPIQNNAKFQNYTDGKKKLPKATFLATPRSYTEDPLFTSQVSPETINPRYLNINSQLNDINRVQSAINKNKSGISSVDRSNIFQGQINAYNQLQNLFDQKYNYDRQQDSNVEQFNAQSRANTKLQNLGERNRFMDLIQRRRGILDTQMRTDINADIQNSMLANQYNLTSDYLQGALHPTTSYTFGADVVNSYGDYEKLKEMADKAKAADKLYGKFGGKIKLKNKKSSK